MENFSSRGISLNNFRVKTIETLRPDCIDFVVTYIKISIRQSFGKMVRITSKLSNDLLSIIQ